MSVETRLSFDEFIASSRADWERAFNRAVAKEPSSTPEITAGGADSRKPTIEVLYTDRPTHLQAQSGVLCGLDGAGYLGAFTARVDGSDADSCVAQIELAATSGATRVTIVSGNAGCALESVEDLSKVLSAAHARSLKVSLECGPNGIALAAMLAALPGSISSVVTELRYDPFLNLTQSQSGRDRLSRELKLLQELTNVLPALTYSLALDARVVVEAGGSQVQELAYCLSAITELLRASTGSSVAGSPRKGGADALRSGVSVLCSVGSNIFTEIAKLRAMRTLWSFLWKPIGGAAPLLIVAVSSRWNRTRDEPHVNLLRTGASALAAVCGGASQVELMPFALSGSSDETLGRRLAVSFQQVLAHESWLCSVSDPAGGSFFVEHFTKELCEQSWSLFQTYERRGGLLAVLNDGTLRDEVRSEAALKRERFLSGKEVLVGLNRFRTDSRAEGQQNSQNLEGSEHAKAAEHRTRKPTSRRIEKGGNSSKSLRIGNSEVTAQELIEAAKRGATVTDLQSRLGGPAARSGERQTADLERDDAAITWDSFCVQREYDLAQSASRRGEA